jgi:hypothetical protein
MQYNHSLIEQYDESSFQEQRKKNSAYVIVNIDGENKHVCINWLRRCNGGKTQCQHSYNRYHGEGFINMVCSFHLSQPQGCWRNDHRDPSKRCLKKHYPELLNFFPQDKKSDQELILKPKNLQISRPKIATCKAFMLQTTCPYGLKCSYAHGIAQMKESNIFIDLGLKGQEIIPFEKILSLIHHKLTIFKDIIDKKKLENSDTRFGNVEECVPDNFIKLLDKIVNISRMSKEVQDDFTGETRWILNRPDIGFTDEQYDDFIALCRKFHVCEKHVKYHVSKICDKNYKPKVDEICNHSINCKKGCHIFEGENEICFENLCGHPCQCKFKTSEAAEINKEMISKSINSFKVELKKSTDPSEINRLELCIEKFVKDYIESNPKIHLSKYNIKFSKLSMFTDTSHVTFNHNMVPSKKFNYEDPEFTKYMKAEIKKKQELNLHNLKALIIQTAFRLYKFKIIKSELSPQTNETHLEYISSGAYFVGISLEKYKTIKIEFDNWTKYWKNMTFNDFHSFVLKKTEIWNSIDTTTHIENDVVVETHIASEKDNYLNFWSWLRKIPIHQDIMVIGESADIVQDAYDLFLTYKDECPKFNITFSDWIKSKPSVLEAVELMKLHSVMYICAKRYIDMDVKKTGLSVEEFSKYNYNTIKVWMKTNYEIEHLKKYKPEILGIEPINIQTFISDEESYVEYYLGGWWNCYNKDHGFNSFISDKQNGWKYVPLKNSIVPSLKYEHEQLLLVKKEKEERIKNQQKEMLEAKIKENKEKKNKLAAMRAAKKNKGDNKKNIDQNSSSDSSSDSISDSDSDSDSDSEIEFKSDSNFDFKSEIKKDNNQQLNAMMDVPYNNLYVYRDLNDRGTNNIHIGPFETESKAKKVMESIRMWNKKASRTMKPRIVIDDIPGMKTSWNIVFGDTTNTKKEIRGINPYEWVLSLINHLCNTSLFDTHNISMFHTNIDYIDYQLYEARNKVVSKPNN